MNALYKLYEFIFFAYWNPDKDDMKDIYNQTLHVFILEIIVFPLAAIFSLLNIDVVMCPTCSHLINVLILSPAIAIVYLSLFFLFKKQKFRDHISQKVSEGMRFNKYTLSYRIKMISVLILIPILCIAIPIIIFLFVRK